MCTLLMNAQQTNANCTAARFRVEFAVNMTLRCFVATSLTVVQGGLSSSFSCSARVDTVFANESIMVSYPHYIPNLVVGIRNSVRDFRNDLESLWYCSPLSPVYCAGRMLIVCLSEWIVWHRTISSTEQGG